MANPLSPMNDTHLNARSPMTVRRDHKLDHPSYTATPTKQQQQQQQQQASQPPEQSEVIDWDDDDDVSSSPFMTEAAECRAASRDWRLATGTEPEVDAIFEDDGVQDIQTSTARRDFDTEYDKENVHVSHDVCTPRKALKPFSPVKARPGSSSSTLSSAPSSRPVSRDEVDTMAMPPPPPSSKKSSRVSPVKKTIDIAADMALPKSRDSSFEQLDDSETRAEESAMPDVDDTFAGADETNVDDTCFSTFSVIPEMTLFAKLGESSRKSPVKHVSAVSESLYRESAPIFRSDTFS